MTQRRVEKTRVHFWTFSPVSVKTLIIKFLLLQSMNFEIFWQIFRLYIFTRLTVGKSKISNFCLTFKVLRFGERFDFKLETDRAQLPQLLDVSSGFPLNLKF